MTVLDALREQENAARNQLMRVANELRDLATDVMLDAEDDFPMSVAHLKAKAESVQDCAEIFKAARHARRVEEDAQRCRRKARTARVAH